jgi:hypothetical protein
MRVASDVEKRREMGQIGIFSPLLYQLSYPAKNRTHITLARRVLARPFEKAAKLSFAPV